MSRLPQQPDRWPLQSFVAPFSWMTARDVEQGRDKLNFSTWDQDDGEADDAADAVADAAIAAAAGAAMCSPTPTPP
ncbi:MAG TPA: heme-binding domain-containing protein [Streptosporangiaceae bacterium]